LGSLVAFDMRRNDTRYCIALKPRSLLLMSGESRFAWEHGIAARVSDVLDDGVVLRRGRRLSVTFRKARGVGAQCRCVWPECESQSRAPVDVDAVEVFVENCCVVFVVVVVSFYS
jgi:hypothetical protein